MKGLIAVLTFLAVVAAGAPVVWAQNPDPLHVGVCGAFACDSFATPSVLEGSYITDSNRLQFLMVGSPQACNDGSTTEGDVQCPTAAHIWFYNAACNRIEDRPIPLTENQVRIVQLHSGSVTNNRVGNFIVAGIFPTLGASDILIPVSNAIIGQTFFVDVNRGIGRLEELARLAGDAGNGWSPYKPAHALLFAPPDDGNVTTDTLLVRCPVGTTRTTSGGTTKIVGTQLTLGGDMLDLASQAQGNTAGAAFSFGTASTSTTDLCDDCDFNGTFAVRILGDVFDLDENRIGSFNVACRCLGVDPGTGFVAEVRLRDLMGEAANKSTYWELVSGGGSTGDEIFTASINIQAKSGNLNANFFGRLFNARIRHNFTPQPHF